MKLTDCDASFYGETALAPGVNGLPNGRKERRGLGVTFWCPLCVKANLPEHRRAMLPVAFAQTLDGGPPQEGWRTASGEMRHRNHWQRTGETLETLTLSPSIDASGQKHDHGPGWHGHVVNGQCVGGGI
jgi:hypothetical protein